MKGERGVCGKERGGCGFTTTEILARFSSSSLDPVRFCVHSAATGSLFWSFTLHMARNLFLIFRLNFLARYIAFFTLLLEIIWLFFSNIYALIYFGTLTALSLFFLAKLSKSVFLQALQIPQLCRGFTLLP